MVKIIDSLNERQSALPNSMTKRPFWLVRGVCYAPFTLQAIVPWLKVFLRGITAPRSLHFVRVVHTTGGRPLIGNSVLTVNNSRMTVLQMLVTKRQPPLTSTHLMSPYYMERRPNHNLMYIWTTPLVTVVRNSYVHAQNCLCNAH